MIFNWKLVFILKFSKGCWWCKNDFQNGGGKCYYLWILFCKLLRCSCIILNFENEKFNVSVLILNLCLSCLLNPIFFILLFISIKLISGWRFPSQKPVMIFFFMTDNVHVQKHTLASIGCLFTHIRTLTQSHGNHIRWSNKSV